MANNAEASSSSESGRKQKPGQKTKGKEKADSAHPLRKKRRGSIDLSGSSDGGRPSGRTSSGGGACPCRIPEHDDACGKSCGGRRSNCKGNGSKAQKGRRGVSRAALGEIADLASQLGGERDALKELRSDKRDLENTLMLRTLEADASGQEAKDLRDQIQAYEDNGDEQTDHFVHSFDHSWTEECLHSRLIVALCLITLFVVSCTLEGLLGSLFEYVTSVVICAKTVKTGIDLFLLVPFLYATLATRAVHISRALGGALFLVALSQYFLSSSSLGYALLILLADCFVSFCFDCETLLFPRVHHRYRFFRLAETYDLHSSLLQNDQDWRMRRANKADLKVPIVRHADMRSKDMSMAKCDLPAQYVDLKYQRSGFYGFFNREQVVRVSMEFLVQLTGIRNFNYKVDLATFNERMIYKAQSIYGVNVSRWPILDGQYVVQNTIDVAYGMFRSYLQRTAYLPRPDFPLAKGQ